MKAGETVYDCVLLQYLICILLDTFSGLQCIWAAGRGAEKKRKVCGVRYAKAENARAKWLWTDADFPAAPTMMQDFAAVARCDVLVLDPISSYSASILAVARPSRPLVFTIREFCETPLAEIQEQLERRSPSTAN